MNLHGKVRTMNIITKNMKQFKYIEKQLYEKQAIALQITNNKRKSMLKSNIIVNVDLTEEELNKCTFPQNIIIINLKNKINTNSIKFEGINVNDCTLNIKREIKPIDGFTINSLYESILYENKSKLKELIENEIEINSLIGINGKIEQSEFKYA